MSQENVDVFKRGVDAANRSDTEAFLELLHPEVEWHTVFSMVGGEAVYRGIGEASGAAIDSPFAYLIEFRDGKPCLIRSFLDPNKALEAAGLTE